jgi:predicted nucleic acid-binding protein
MIIALDTNILHDDFLMKSGRFAVLLDYVQKTQSKIILPKIVYDELAATYERELRRRLNQFVRSRGALAALLQNSLPELNLLVESETASYLSYVKEKLNIQDKDIFDYKESYLHDVLERAIHRRRPCTERGEEIRDAVLWHSVLDIAEETTDKTVIFISHNTKQFTLDENSLHPDLIEDYTKRNLTVKYFTSLDSFAKQHASNIEFITKEWLLSFIDVNAVIEGSRGIIESYAEYRLSSLLPDGKSSTGYFKFIQGSLDVENYYVYEMSDGPLRVEVMLTGETEVECEVEKIVRKEEYDYDYEYDLATREYEYVPVTRYRSDAEYEYEYLYPVVYITLEVIVENKDVTEWKIIDGSFEQGVKMRTKDV